MSDIIMVPAGAAEFREFYRREPQRLWFGVAATSSGRVTEIVGFGSVWWDDWGRAWASIDGAEAISRFALYRWIRKAIAALMAVGEPALHAFVASEEARPGGQRLLARLGFARDEGLSAALAATGDTERSVWILPLFAASVEEAA